MIYPIDPEDLQKQDIIYRSVLDYVLHFSLKYRSMLTWVWLPASSNYIKGAGLPLDWMYLPKSAYCQMQYLVRVLPNSIYRLSSQSEADKCLGTSDQYINGSVQLSNGSCYDTNQRWNIPWLGDGTYRFSPECVTRRVLNALNATVPVDGDQTNDWSSDFNQEWSFSRQVNKTFRIVPCTD